MNLLSCMLICLTNVLPQVTSQDEEAIDRLSCAHESTKAYVVKKHNELRSNVTPSPTNMLQMEWNDEAAKIAAIWASKCSHEHSKAEDREISECECGENLYMASSAHTWEKAIQAWYDEVKDFEYGYGQTKENAMTSHYTQLVWYRSNWLGCAFAYCPNQPLFYYYVCLYCPAGNSEDDINTPYEKGESCAKCPHACSNGLCTNPCKYKNNFKNCKDFTDLCNDTDEDVAFVKDECEAACKCETEIQ